MAAKRRDGLATKTVRNQLNFLHGVFAWAVKRRLGGLESGGCRGPPAGRADDPDIRWIDVDDLEAIIGSRAGRYDTRRRTGR